MRLLLLITWMFASQASKAIASHSNPPKIQVEDCVSLGTTTDPFVKVFIKPLMRFGVPEKDQIFRVKIVIDARETMENTTLYIGDTHNDLVSSTALKPKKKGDYYHYEFTLGIGYIRKSSVFITFKKGTGTITKDLEFGIGELPKPSESGRR